MNLYTITTIFFYFCHPYLRDPTFICPASGGLIPQGKLVRLYRVTSRTAASHPSYREFLCNMRAIHKYHVIRQKNNFELAALSSSPATSCDLGVGLGTLALEL